MMEPQFAGVRSGAYYYFMVTWTREQFFKFIHSHHLIYNQCWEDPLLDQEALKIAPDDNVLLITSAGCNALDYLLHAPSKVDAVDVNSKQNALLQLKMSAIKNLEYADFYKLFGEGSHSEAHRLYADSLRPSLPLYAQSYWDKNIDFFIPKGWRQTFYYHGTSGFFARLMTHYVSMQGMRGHLLNAFSANSINEQREIYYTYLKPQFWNDFLRWVSRRGATMSALGVPRSQFLQVEKYYAGGMAKFIEDCLDAVFANLPLKDNYFWFLYLFGQYSKECCPEYLKEQNFKTLKDNIHKIETHNCSILTFLENVEYPLHKVSLLDHMDWLYQRQTEVLQKQWSALLQKSTPRTKIIWRSASLKADFVDKIPVKVGNHWRYVGDHLDYEEEKAHTLHQRDRVHTYGSFYIAKVVS